MLTTVQLTTPVLMNPTYDTLNFADVPIQERLWGKRAWKDSMESHSAQGYFKILMGSDYIAKEATPLRDLVYETIHFVMNLTPLYDKKDILEHFKLTTKFNVFFKPKNALILLIFCLHIARQSYLDGHITKHAEENLTEILNEIKTANFEKFKEITKEDFALKFDFQPEQEQPNPTAKETLEKWKIEDAQVNRERRRGLIRGFVATAALMSVAAVFSALHFALRPSVSSVTFPDFKQINSLCKTATQEKLNTVFDGLVVPGNFFPPCQDLYHSLLNEGYCGKENIKFDDLIENVRNCEIKELTKLPLETVTNNKYWSEIVSKVSREDLGKYGSNNFKNINDDELLKLPLHEVQFTKFTAKQIVFLIENFKSGKILQLLSDEQFVDFIENLDQSSFTKICHELIYGRFRFKLLSEEFGHRLLTTRKHYGSYRVLLKSLSDSQLKYHLQHVSPAYLIERREDLFNDLSNDELKKRLSYLTDDQALDLLKKRPKLSWIKQLLKNERIRHKWLASFA